MASSTKKSRARRFSDRMVRVQSLVCGLNVILSHSSPPSRHDSWHKLFLPSHVTHQSTYTKPKPCGKKAPDFKALEFSMRRVAFNVGDLSSQVARGAGNRSGGCQQELNLTYYIRGTISSIIYTDHGELLKVP